MVIKKIKSLIEVLACEKKDDCLIDAINEIKMALHAISPFNNNAIDCVLWKKTDNMVVSALNVNHIAPTEKKLLYNSLLENGFTQPIILSRRFGSDFIVDGAKRHNLIMSKATLRTMCHHYIPVCYINNSVDEFNDMAICYRHNHARGKTVIPKLSDFVGTLARQGWSDLKIATQLGMDDDAVLRLKQIDGIDENFKDVSFSFGWTVK